MDRNAARSAIFDRWSAEPYAQAIGERDRAAIGLPSNDSGPLFRRIVALAVQREGGEARRGGGGPRTARRRRVVVAVAATTATALLSATPAWATVAAGGPWTPEHLPAGVRAIEPSFRSWEDRPLIGLARSFCAAYQVSAVELAEWERDRERGGLTRDQVVVIGGAAYAYVCPQQPDWAAPTDGGPV